MYKRHIQGAWWARNFVDGFYNTRAKALGAWRAVDSAELQAVQALPAEAFWNATFSDEQSAGLLAQQNNTGDGKGARRRWRGKSSGPRLV